MLEAQHKAKVIREKLLNPVSGHVSTELEIVAGTEHARRRAQHDREQLQIQLQAQRREALAAAMRDLIARKIEMEEQRKLLRQEEIRELGGGLPPLKLEEIIRAVRNHFGLSLAQLFSVRRSLDVVRPRQIIMYLARKFTTLSLPQIGQRVGRMDHTTVICGHRRIVQLLEQKHSIANDIKAIKQSLGIPDSSNGGSSVG